MPLHTLTKSRSGKLRAGFFGRFMQRFKHTVPRPQPDLWSPLFNQSYSASVYLFLQRRTNCYCMVRRKLPLIRWLSLETQVLRTFRRAQTHPHIQYLNNRAREKISVIFRNACSERRLYSHLPADSGMSDYHLANE